ncbi:sulfite exporter TauE/SafE family protein [Vibrio ponticus]|uniref:Probable membrane transporter protein n=1 Tax=Vibrio ponticus TaxID=265668 RepID=A0A3N3DVG7_9VIBR|nr:sulfite exporter TauE/SafE family protein [Vibrio ponticus]ROV58410.1 sulfite exporter TauE/SafE family protein [Vibrio ponticus]
MDWWVLVVAGVFGGILNSVAGGGSFITFPALMFVGIPPIMANATNTFAVSAGYISGAYGFRHDIAKQPEVVLPIVLLSLLGGALGAILLLNISDQLFAQAIPWLLLFATFLFVAGDKLSQHLAQYQGARILLALMLVLVSAYGGFFNAGLGIVVLSYLVVAKYTDINQMNGLKLLVSSCVSLSAIVIFFWQGVIEWLPGLAVLVGSVIGGYIAARVSRQINPSYVRNFVTLSSVGMTLYFFVDVYA